MSPQAKNTRAILGNTPTQRIPSKLKLGHNQRKIPTRYILRALQRTFLAICERVLPASNCLLNDKTIETPTMNRKVGNT